MNKSLRNLLFAGAAVAIPAAINALMASRVGRVEQPLSGDRGYYDWVFGRVAFYRQGQGQPLLLVHHPHAGGSSWEWRKVFTELAAHFNVYAIDLLGFGLSEKPDVPYSGRMFGDLVYDFLTDVVGGAAALGIGSGFGASYLVNAAVRAPERLQQLVLVNPTGGMTMSAPGIEGGLSRALHVPVLGASLYNGILTMAALENELRRHIYADPSAVTPDMAHDLYTSAHQLGSRYAAAAYLSGRLSLPMRQAFSSLTQPVLLIWGREAYYTPVSDAIDLLYRHPEAKLSIIDACGMIPHDEKAGEFLALTTKFLRPPKPDIQAA